MRSLKRRSMRTNVTDTIVRSDVADECEAFLAGEYTDACHRRSQRPPVWAWLNEAAHANSQRLHVIAETFRADDADVELRTRSTLAVAVVSAMSDRQLADLQRDVLVPLELRLAGTELTPRRLVELVGHALYV